MPSPILDLVPAWGFTREISLPVTLTRLGDAYPVLSSSGMRRYDETYSISSAPVITSVAEPWIATLRSLRGALPLEWSPSGTDRQEYFAEEWKIHPVAQGRVRLSLALKRFAVAAPTPLYGDQTLDLVLNWETVHDDLAIVNSRRVGEGVDRRAPLQQNSITRQSAVRILTRSEADLNLFLLRLYGRPFRLPEVNRQVEGLGGRFSCVRWNFEALSPGHSRFSSQFVEMI
jgi:hypothetical protein